MKLALVVLAVIAAATPQFAFAQFVTGTNEGVSAPESSAKAKAAPKAKKTKSPSATKSQ